LEAESLGAFFEIADQALLLVLQLLGIIALGAAEHRVKNARQFVAMAVMAIGAPRRARSRRSFQFHRLRR